MEYNNEIKYVIMSVEEFNSTTLEVYKINFKDKDDLIFVALNHIECPDTINARIRNGQNLLVIDRYKNRTCYTIDLTPEEIKENLKCQNSK